MTMRVLRTYARAYATDLDELTTALGTVTGDPVTTRFALPNGLQLAAVGRVLAVAGDEQTLRPYTKTAATLIVDDLNECLARLDEAGARIVRGPQDVPTGRNVTAQMPGGVQLEYVEWDEAQWQREGGRPA
ncbi:VOC family protein [Streptomyces sp. SDT5-1]|uniref:VOC family protein n=1 Tax=Streptomyces sp. SDT5-1 TaxID=3406418 RepID=UPI003FD18648